MFIAQLDILTNKYVQIILNSKFFEVWKSIAIGIGIFVLLMFLKNIFTKYIIKILDGIFKVLKIKSARKILIAFEQPIKMAFIVMGVYIFMTILNSSMEWNISNTINKLLGTSIIVLFANGLINITNNSNDFLFRATDKYIIDNLVEKEVVLFLGEADNNSLTKIQAEEIEDYRWCNYEEAQNLLTFDSGRRILSDANKFLCERI